MKTKKTTRRARKIVSCIALAILMIYSVLYENGLVGTLRNSPEETSEPTVTVAPKRTTERWSGPEDLITDPLVGRTMSYEPTTLSGNNTVTEIEDSVFEEVPPVEEPDYSAFLQGDAPERTIICNDQALIAEFQQYLADYQDGTVNPQTLESYLSEDEYLLARILDCEAGGTHDLNELLCVGWTVLCRINSSCNDFRNVHTVMDVLSQRNQYPETYRKIQNGHSATDQCKLAAHILLTTPRILAHDKNGTWYVLGKDMLFQTGFHPTWNVYEIFETPYHVYSGE